MERIESGPVQPFENRRRLILPLAAILLTGLLLRTWGLSWGLPERTDLHPDEFMYVIQHALNVSWQQPDPGFINYPSFLCYSTALIHGALKHFDSARPDWKAYLVGRAISAVYGTLTILVVFCLARRLGADAIGALLAAAWTALLPLHVWDSHVAATDVMMTFWIMATLLAAVHLQSTPRVSIALLAGLSLGLATGSKYTAAVTCLAPLVAVLLAPVSWSRRVALLGVVAAASLIACFLVTPFSFLRFRDLLAAMAFENAHTHSHHYGFSVPAAGFQYRRGIYQLFAAWPFSFGIPLYLAAIVGTLRFAWKPARIRWIILAFAAAFLFLTCRMTYTPIRYYMPLIVLGTLCAALWLGTELAATPRGARFWLMLVLVLAITGYTTAFTVSSTRRYAHDTRIAAERWIAANMAPNETLNVFGLNHYFGLARDISRCRILPEDDIIQVKLASTNDLLEISSLHYLRHVRHDNHPFIEQYFRLQNSPDSFELLARFDAPFLNRDLYGRLDPMFRCYFVAPTIEIYRPRHDPEVADIPGETEAQQLAH